MISLKYSSKLATLPYQTQTGQQAEVVVPVVVVTPLDGKVYRLLRPDENAECGIFAKNKLSAVSAVYHVAWGSTHENFRENQCLNGDIVSIDVDTAQVDLVHVYDEGVRTRLISQELIVNPKTDPVTIFRFNTFAEANNEVLLVGDVPASCVTVITNKQCLPNCNIITA
ncbi:unnamed protein product [Mytilus edulis]|uniref:Uncharacterized protein n=1 Tax=Mytilus edulis TaxID=6550 RepID=A0A8S3UK55_MYTED|nr:unnamed protein product [Mytilus edulis]